jgi:hypothetical protein
MICLSGGRKVALLGRRTRYLAKPLVKEILSYVTKATKGRIRPVVVG